MRRPLNIAEVPEEGRCWCCFIDPSGVECQEPAVWWIGTKLAPDDYTHACIEHRAALTRAGDTVVSLAWMLSC